MMDEAQIRLAASRIVAAMDAAIGSSNSNVYFTWIGKAAMVEAFAAFGLLVAESKVPETRAVPVAAVPPPPGARARHVAAICATSVVEEHLRSWPGFGNLLADLPYRELVALRESLSARVEAELTRLAEEGP